jgi:hypothetical protein
MRHSHGEAKRETQRQKVKFQGTNLADVLIDWNCKGLLRILNKFDDALGEKHPRKTPKWAKLPHTGLIYAFFK